MSTLVIGAGLVGSQVARVLAEEGETPVLMDFAAQADCVGQIVPMDSVTMIQGDILRPLSVVKAINDHGITGIIHTAANPMLTLGAQTDPYAAINLNIMGTVNVLEAARVTGVKRVVVSSSNVLNHYLAGGNGLTEPMNEEAWPRPTTFYSATKQAIESLGLNYAKWCGVEFAGMRYGAVFGPWSGAGGGGPSNVVRTALRNLMAGKEATIPAGTMEWVYSKDAGRGTVLALRANDLGNGVFNVTMAQATPPEEMEAALKVLFPEGKIRIETPKGTAVSLPNMRRTSDLSNSKATIGYEPQFDIRTALADMHAWMKANATAA
ncbi:MAG: NAD-dependent epimerase/dehydratase family protein [Beijerinckiaceae bacterium]